VQHSNSDNYVTYTYAAITIDRILIIKKWTQLLCVRIHIIVILHSRSDPRFSQADIHDIAADLLNALLRKIEAVGPPQAEKVAENDHLMKCKSIK
jgi:exportin-2 (importin alpha re-exporter)